VEPSAIRGTVGPHGFVVKVLDVITVDVPVAEAPEALPIWEDDHRLLPDTFRTELRQAVVVEINGERHKVLMPEGWRPYPAPGYSRAGHDPEAGSGEPIGIIPNPELVAAARGRRMATPAPGYRGLTPIQAEIAAQNAVWRLIQDARVMDAELVAEPGSVEQARFLAGDS
jgi:hypothetical protein